MCLPAFVSVTLHSNPIQKNPYVYSLEYVRTYFKCHCIYKAFSTALRRICFSCHIVIYQVAQPKQVSQNPQSLVVIGQSVPQTMCRIFGLFLFLLRTLVPSELTYVSFSIRMQLPNSSPKQLGIHSWTTETQLKV